VWWENTNVSMAHTLGNKCAKNCCKRTILVQLIVENVVTCCFETQFTTCTPNLYSELVVARSTRADFAC